MWGLRWMLWSEPAPGCPPSPESGDHRGLTGVGHAQGPRPAMQTARTSGRQPLPGECLPSHNLSPGRWGEDRDARAAGKNFWKVTQKEALRGEGGGRGTARIPRGVLLLCHGKCHGQCSWGLVFKGKNAAKPEGRFPTVCPALLGSCRMWAQHPVTRYWGRGGHLDPTGTSSVTLGHE